MKVTKNKAIAIGVIAALVLGAIIAKVTSKREEVVEEAIITVSDTLAKDSVIVATQTLVADTAKQDSAK